jgi:hypothetical protein
MRIVFKWGLLLAVAVVLWTMLIHLLGFYTTRIQYAETADLAAFVLPLAILTLALLERRRVLGGSLTIGQGVLTGLGVAAVSALPTVAFLWFYHHVVNPDWLSILVDYKQQQLTAAGMSSEQVATTLSQIQRGGTDRMQIVGGLVGTMGMGVVLSLGITLVLKFSTGSREPS